MREPAEPCLCGAIDCARCYPNSYREAEYDEDADEEEDRRDHDREDAEARAEWVRERDDDDPDAAYEPGDPKRTDFLDAED